MTVTKQTYTATATWTPSQVANLFRDAFIDAGLMTSWHDSFLSGLVENRILRVEYDGTKAYGSTFYWFQYNTSGVFLQVATGWNTSTDQPTGTQYLDFFSTATNTSNNHWQLYASGEATTIKLIRYTSGIDPSQSWFVITGAGRRTFTIAPASSSLQPWINLDRGFYNGFIYTTPAISSNAGVINFRRGPSLRRDIITGPALNGDTLTTAFNNVSNTNQMAYAAPGHASAGGTALSNLGNNQQSVFLPVGFTSSNPAYPSNSNPVFHSMPYSPYLLNSFASDFGMSFHYATNTFSAEDTLVVSPGVEEWEVLDFTPGTINIVPSPLFIARVV